MRKPLNKIWHEKHKLGMPSTLEQRVKWHEQHLKHCGCRKDLPRTIIAALKKQDKKVCTRGHIYAGKGPCPICWPGGSLKAIRIPSQPIGGKASRIPRMLPRKKS